MPDPAKKQEKSDGNFLRRMARRFGKDAPLFFAGFSRRLYNHPSAGIVTKTKDCEKTGKVRFAGKSWAGASLT